MIFGSVLARTLALEFIYFIMVRVGCHKFGCKDVGQQWNNNSPISDWVVSINKTMKYYKLITPQNC